MPVLHPIQVSRSVRRLSRFCHPSLTVLSPLNSISLQLSLSPSGAFHAQLDSGETPVLAMVVTPAREPGARLGLLVSEDGQDAENDGHAEVEADAHQALGDGVGDVLEVHGLALDQHADGDDGVEGARGRRGRVGHEGGQVGGRGAEEVAGAGRDARGGLLDLRGRVHAIKQEQRPGGISRSLRGSGRVCSVRSVWIGTGRKAEAKAEKACR